MEFVWTKHASETFADRPMARSWVERVVLAPEWREPDPDDVELERLFAPVPELGGRIMRVVVCFEAVDRCRVITFFLDRGARGA